MFYYHSKEINKMDKKIASINDTIEIYKKRIDSNYKKFDEKMKFITANNNKR